MDVGIVIKILQVGCGKMSKYTMKYAFLHGASVVGAVDVDKKLIGLDIGEIMETEAKNVLVESIDDIEKVIKNKKPDIAIIETMSMLIDIRDLVRTCVSNKVNVITTCEEAFFAENSNPRLWREIDILAKANNVTVTGSGYQDVFWGNLVSTLAGTTNKIAKIKGSSSYNVEDYGIALARAHGVGLSLEEFEEKIAKNDRMSDEERNRIIDSGEYTPSYMWNTVGWLADKLGLHIIKMNQTCIPQTHDQELQSSTLNMTIAVGDVTGMSAMVTAETEEGTIIEAECIGKVYAPEEVDTNEWTIIGEPETTVTIKQPSTVELTCANIINRIPDVINAEAGFISTSKMPAPSYKVKNLDEYLQ